VARGAKIADIFLRHSAGTSRVSFSYHPRAQKCAPYFRLDFRPEKAVINAPRVVVKFNTCANLCKNICGALTVRKARWNHFGKSSSQHIFGSGVGYRATMDIVLHFPRKW
jgi:hypothetical protein